MPIIRDLKEYFLGDNTFYPPDRPGHCSLFAKTAKAQLSLQEVWLLEQIFLEKEAGFEIITEAQKELNRRTLCWLGCNILNCDFRLNWLKRKILREITIYR